MKVNLVKMKLIAIAMIMLCCWVSGTKAMMDDDLFPRMNVRLQEAGNNMPPEIEGLSMMELFTRLSQINLQYSNLKNQCQQSQNPAVAAALVETEVIMNDVNTYMMHANVNPEALKQLLIIEQSCCSRLSAVLSAINN